MWMRRFARAAPSNRFSRGVRQESRLFAACVEALEARRLLSTTTLFVDQAATGSDNGLSWANAYNSLQDALTDASTQHYGAPGTPIVIDVAQGTYSPGNSTGDSFGLIDGVTLDGGFATGGSVTANPAANPTTLAGQNINHSVVTAAIVDDTAVLNGFTITGGNYPTLDQGNGGGLFAYEASPTIVDCTFSNNTAFFGGAVAVQDFAGEGQVAASPTFTDCTFNDNSAIAYGGAIYAGNQLGSPTMIGCSFTDNSAQDTGGALYIDYSGDGSVTEVPIITNCAFRGNTSGTFAGAIYTVSNSPIITNCTFTQNSSHNAGAIAAIAATLTVENSIFWNDSATFNDEIENASSSLTVNNSDIDGGFAGNNNINVDPLFVSSTNLQLQTNSLCIDAGNSSASGLMGISTDLAGNPRIFGPAVDMGAYENQTPQPVASKLVFVQQPTVTLMGNTIGPAVTVAVEDTGGDLVIRDHSSVTISINNPGMGVTLGGTLTEPVVGGVATFSGLSINTSGAYTLHVADGTLAAANSSAFNISHLVFLQEPTPALPGVIISPAVTVEVANPDGSVVTTDNSSITISLNNPGTASLNGTLTEPAVSGVATFSTLSSYYPGTYTLHATNGTLATADSTAFEIIPAHLVFVQQPVGTSTASVISPAMTVELEDFNNNLLTIYDGSDINLAINNPGNGVVLSGTTSEPLVNGFATFSTLSINTAGTYTFQASDSSFTVGNSTSFVIAARPLDILQEPVGVPTGTAISPAVTVAIEDTAGNILTGNNSDVTISLNNPGNGVVLSGTLTEPAENGVATFSNLSINTVGTYTLHATDGGFAPTDSTSFIVTLPVVGTTIFVDTAATGANNGSGWANAYTSLQTALIAAQDQRDVAPNVPLVIDVAKGTYTPGGATTATFQLINGVSLDGGFATGGSATANPAANPTILSGQSSNYDVLSSSGNDDTAILNGFTISGGNADGSPVLSLDRGGGLLINDGSPTILNCTFSDNSASYYGGAVWVLNGAPAFSDCTFTGNSAGTGGAVFNDEFNTPLSTTTSFTNCQFTNNTAGSGGAVADFTADEGPAMSFLDCTFSGNSVTQGGGAIESYGDGSGSSQFFTNCVFLSNSATSLGGALSTFGGISPVITNCTFTENSSAQAGAVNFDDGTLTIENSIFWNNTAPSHPEIFNQSAGTLSVTNSDVQGGVSGTNDINSDPLFVSTTNLQLQSGSPCVDAGDDSAPELSGITTDLAGNPRVVGSAVDIGAFERAPATKIVFGQLPTGTMPGLLISPAVTVKVEDSEGDVLGSDHSNVTISINNPGNGVVLSGTLTEPAVNGIATFSNLSINTSGTYTLHVTDSALTPADSPSFVIALPLHLVFGQTPGSVTAGATLSPVVTVKIEDPTNNIVTSDTSNVTLSVATGPSSTLNGTVTVAAVDGVATFSQLSLNTAGTYTLRAVDGGDAAGTSANIIVNAGVAAKLEFAPTPGTATAGIAINPAITVDIDDAFGNVITGNTSSVKLALGSVPAHATMAGTTTEKANHGAAAFTNIVLNIAGNYTLKATDGSLTAATSGVFAVNPGAATVMAYVKEPVPVTAGNPISPAVVVELKDKFGNIATNNSSNLTLAIKTGPKNATVGGIKTVAVSNGMATFADLVLNTAGSYILSATDASLPAVPSSTFAVSAAAASTLVFGALPAAPVAGKLSPFTVSVEDAFGNVVKGATVALSINSGPSGAMITGTSSAVATTGVATFSNVSLLTAGTYTFLARVGGMTQASGSFTVAPAAASQIIFSLPPANTTTGTPFDVILHLLDKYENLVTTNSSTVAVALLTHPTGGTLGGSLTAKASGGVVTFTGLSLSAAGNYTFKFTDGSLKLTSATVQVT
jgi:predicted outer membrane repeat protein